MIIYNITTKVSPIIEGAWLAWTKQDYLPAIVQTGLFHDFRVCRLLDQDDSDGATYVVQCFTDTLENYETYLQEHAPSFLKKATMRFGDQFVSFRTIMQIV
ncbi:protein of unknown function [Chitinophaga costaii]|uniref:DUF4286 domain-containing protein n=1 Tax=Chitinophaga costaii TaxID=1335309 RepID=A0A1C4A8T6_9BACT|nr:DUF4286 family protein [Chitinophaga costaii]PUZ26502.1 DUF4286 domain-containing protein [Chitinophaga costaii]SCB90883.1 protein of unknown function [Chitinophaga costaii]